MRRSMPEVIVDSMLAVEKRKPVVNDSSFALKILWDIFEEAVETEIDSSLDVESENSDEQIEEVFHNNFGSFIENYPAQMTLTPTTEEG